MKGCIEKTGPTPNITYFMKDSVIVAKRVISTEWQSSNIAEKWYKDGKYHRDGDLPAVIRYDENGQKFYEYWYKDGKLHRDGDLPAVISYHENGQKYTEYWYKDDKRYRDGGLPTSVWYKKYSQERYGRVHRFMCEKGVLLILLIILSTLTLLILGTISRAIWTTPR